MKKQEVKIDGIRYQVSSTTDAGLKDAVRMLKKSLKRSKDEDNDNNKEVENV